VKVHTHFNISNALCTIIHFLISGSSNFCGLNPELYKAHPETEDDDKEYPANHLGRVWYALEYETTSERLLVTLMKARNLPESRSSNGILSCNPLVRIALFPDERRTLQSKLKKMTSHPQFNETFGFQVYDVILRCRPSHCTLIFCVNATSKLLVKY